MNKKRIILVHGWGETPENNWFPWLKRELEKIGCEVYAPQMPDAEHPEVSRWAECLRETVGTPDENTYLVGHSLGVITILRYLESLEDGEKVGGAILVAGFPENVPVGRDRLNSFFTTKLNFEKAKRAANHFIAIHSDNDYHVPLENGEILRDNLNAELIVMKDSGHFTGRDGFYELPIVAEKLKEIL